jgi:hypothetical protein
MWLSCLLNAASTGSPHKRFRGPCSVLGLLNPRIGGYKALYYALYYGLQWC